MLYHLLFLLLVKHMICDFAIQGRLKTDHDKWKLTSRKGHLHALDHALGTSIVFTLLCISLAINLIPINLWCIILFGVLDYVFHFTIDWLKNNIVKENNFKKDSREFWILTSVDQTLHVMTYWLFVIVFDIYFF